MTDIKEENKNEKSDEGLEGVTGEMNERLRLLLSEPVNPELTENLAATATELEEICSLSIPEHEVRAYSYDIGDMFRNDPKRFEMLMNALLSRNFDKVLPIQGESFVYRRYAQECNRLKQSIEQSRSLMARLAKEDPEKLADESHKMVGNIARLLILQTRAAEWLEADYFPGLYEKAANTARGEVMQYLIKQKNTRNLDAFREVDDAKVHFVDEVEYIKRGLGKDPETSAGCIRGGDVYLKMPSHYSDSEEWDVFHVLVHELVHYVSLQDYSGVGISDYEGKVDYNMLNECVTELVTYVIMQGHLDQGKTYLKGQKKSDLMGMAYAEYVVIVKQVLSKVPIEYFVDAMLNWDGMEKLKNKFKEAFGDADALQRYAKNLNDAYMPARERTQAKNDRYAPVIDLDSRRTDY